eukprot:1324449-Prymnesium_polylepis.1
MGMGMWHGHVAWACCEGGHAMHAQPHGHVAWACGMGMGMGMEGGVGGGVSQSHLVTWGSHGGRMGVAHLLRLALAQHLVEARVRLRVVALTHVDVAQHRPRVGVERVEVDAPLEPRDGLLHRERRARGWGTWRVGALGGWKHLMGPSESPDGGGS